MFACAFDLHEESDIDNLASQIRFEQLSRPAGKLLVFQMAQDQLFGPEHVDALCKWAGDSVKVRLVAGEHVGTSQFHYWLPEACDWLSQQLSVKEYCNVEIYNTASYSSLN
jgi:hypothetical protein